MIKTGSCYWRPRGDTRYRYGFAHRLVSGLWQFGYYNGDFLHGPIYDEDSVDVRDYD